MEAVIEIERGGDVKRPKIDHDSQTQKQKAMELDGESSKFYHRDVAAILERLNKANLDASPPPCPPYSDSNPFPFVLRGEPIDLMDLLFTDDRKYLITRDGKKVGRASLRGKAIVLYLFPLNIKVPYEPWTILDMLDAYNELSRITKNTVFVFVAVHIVYTSPFCVPESLRPPEPEYEEQMSHFHRIFNTLPFPTIPFEDQPSRRRIAEAFKLHLGLPYECQFLPYWSIIDRNRTVVASITDPCCYHFFHHFSAEELHPFTRQHIQTVIRQGGSRRDMLSNVDQLLKSFNRNFLLSSKGKKVSVSSLKDRVIGFYIYGNEPNPPNMNLIRRVCKDGVRQNLDFQIVQMCVRFHPSTGLSTKLEYLGQSLSKQQTMDWLQLPFEDPRCKKLLRIFSDVYESDGDEDDNDSVYGRLVIFQPKRDTFELCGVQILREYGIKGYPFTRDHLFEMEKNIAKEKMKLTSLFPPGKHNLKVRKGDKYVPIDNRTLYGKKVLVFYAYPGALKRSGEYISLLKSKYEGRGGFEVVYASFADQCDKDSMSDERTVDMPWLVYSYSKDFKRKLSSELFRRAEPSDIYSGVAASSGVAAFGEDDELITKFYQLDDWSYKYNKGDEGFPFSSLSLEDAIREEVCSICDLDKYSRKLDEYRPEYPLLEMIHPKYDEYSGQVVYPNVDGLTYN